MHLARGGDVLIKAGEVKGLGAFSEYTVADERICFKVPKEIPLAEAATVPLAATTSWLALFSKTCLNIDREKGAQSSVLIWGGSCKFPTPLVWFILLIIVTSASVGLYAIQIAALYGIEVTTTCSPRHFDRVRSLGAKHILNYRDEDVVDQIKKAAPNIRYVFDTIGDPTSSSTASQAISGNGGRLCTVRPGKVYTDNVPKNVTVTDVLVWTVFLKGHSYGEELYWPVSFLDAC
jgi:NADPH:quinone reductase-like Zn-dependent oxidoreductase